MKRIRFMLRHSVTEAVNRRVRDVLVGENLEDTLHAALEVRLSKIPLLSAYYIRGAGLEGACIGAAVAHPRFIAWARGHRAPCRRALKTIPRDRKFVDTRALMATHVPIHQTTLYNPLQLRWALTNGQEID